MSTPTKTRPVLERGLDTSGGVGFVRERLALYARTLFLLSFGFYLFLLAGMTLIAGASFWSVVLGPVAMGHLCASSTVLVLWLTARRSSTSSLTLGALDAFTIIAAGSCLAVMTWNDEGQVLQSLMAITVTVITRAILVPSQPRRTMLLSAMAFVPTIIVCITRHHPTNLLPGFTAGY